jgi:hypothetical protein
MLPRQGEGAVILRLDILAGAATVAHAVAWADGLIAAGPRPDIAVIEVALAGRRSPADMLSLLALVAGTAGGEGVMRRHLGALLRALGADPSRAREVATRLFRYATEGDLPEEAFGPEPYFLDDDVFLAVKEVYGTEAAAREALRAYLLRHAR